MHCNNTATILQLESISIIYICHILSPTLHKLYHLHISMGWLRSVGSIKLQVSLAEYRLFYRALLQKRPIILLILLTKATPCHLHISYLTLYLYHLRIPVFTAATQQHSALQHTLPLSSTYPLVCVAVRCVAVLQCAVLLCCACAYNPK